MGFIIFWCGYSCLKFTIFLNIWSRIKSVKVGILKINFQGVNLRQFSNVKYHSKDYDLYFVRKKKIFVISLILLVIWSCELTRFFKSYKSVWKWMFKDCYEGYSNSLRIQSELTNQKILPSTCVLKKDLEYNIKFWWRYGATNTRLIISTICHIASQSVYFELVLSTLSVIEKLSFQ